jgi:Flp pilus assembly protein TadD
MNRIGAFPLTSVLCVLWLSACASSTPDAAKATAPAAGKAEEAQATPDPSKDLPTTLDGEISRAQALRAKGDFDGAASALAQLMLVAPDDPRIVGEYGKVLVQQGHAKDAQAFLSRAILLQPKDWTLYSALGVADDQLDNHADARLAYEHALALAPQKASVLNNYAVSRMLAGDYAGAQRLLTAASAEDSANQKIANNLAKLASLKGPALRDAGPQPAVAAPKMLPQHIEMRTAMTPPKTAIPAVVMQPVPADPMAGPVKSKSQPSHRVASAAKVKHVAKAPAALPPPPALRTAAEAN